MKITSFNNTVFFTKWLLKIIDTPFGEEGKFISKYLKVILKDELFI